MDVLAGQRGDHLVRVHVRRGARAGLEDIDRELVVALAGGDTICCGGNPLGLGGLEEAQLSVDAGRSCLDTSQPARNGSRDRLSGYREVLHCLARLASPELLPRLGGHAFESRSQGCVETAPLGRPVSQNPPDLLGQIGDEGPADVIAAVALARLYLRPVGRWNLADVAAA